MKRTLVRIAAAGALVAVPAAVFAGPAFADPGPGQPGVEETQKRFHKERPGDHDRPGGPDRRLHVRPGPGVPQGPGYQLFNQILPAPGAGSFGSS